MARADRPARRDPLWTDLERVRDIFVQASRYEWMFWDMGYRKETWPV